MSRSICDEFMLIQKRAIKEPETSEELMEMTAFVEQARTIGMLSFNKRIGVRCLKLSFALFTIVSTENGSVRVIVTYVVGAICGRTDVI